MPYKVYVIGRIGTDAETINKENASYITCRVATDEFINKEKVTRWANLTFDGERFKNLEQYLKKGKMVLVTGTERVTPYLSKSGEPNIDTRIWVDSFEFIQTGTTQSKNNVDSNKLDILMEKIANLENKVDIQTNDNNYDIESIADAHIDNNELPF